MSLKSHWFWRYGYIAIIPLIIGVVWISKGSERENQNNVNPAVFTFFKQVVLECQQLGFDAQTDKCHKITEYRTDCRLVSATCNSLSFYVLLKKLGFDVPQYYQTGFEKK